MIGLPPLRFPSIAQSDVLNVLRLIRTMNVGPVTFFQLIQRFGTVEKALEALPDLSIRGGRKHPLTATPQASVEREYEAAVKFGARFILYGASDYPRLLHFIPDPPPVITVMGHAHLWQKDVVAMVGARNASAGCCQFGGRMAKELGEANITVASGLARGIDTFVHKGSLQTGTVAVIAGGIDNIYPPENDKLYAEIRESGAVISEQPFGSVPFSGSFPGRNRIIAGMSAGTVVVEASPKSGSLITALFAMENDREVFAVPGSPLDPRSKGCNWLIRQGATMAESSADVIQGIAHLRHQALGENPPMTYITNQPGSAPSDAELAHARDYLIEKLGTTPVSVDELIEQCDITAGAALTILLELELAGRLKRSPGNKVYLLEVMEEMA